MIYTVTLNPSLDYIVTVPSFALHATNRTAEEQLLPGGKGINVSIVLKNLGLSTKVLGFVAGSIGTQIETMLADMDLATEFVHLPSGMSRINVKLKNYDGTEINGMGPIITEQAISELKQQLSHLEDGDTLVLAGSIPSSMPSTIYRDLLEMIQTEATRTNKEIHFVVDATGDLLKNVLPFRPFLIKPNEHELGALFDVTLKTQESVVPYAKKLQELGARNVCVSMAGNGAVLLDETGGVHMLPAPHGTLVNAVGAGDSMVAGFLYGWETTHDYDAAFRMAVSAGSASAFSEQLATREEILVLYEVVSQPSK